MTASTLVKAPDISAPAGSVSDRGSIHVGIMDVAAGLATTGEATVVPGITGVVVAAMGDVVRGWTIGVVAAATAVDEMIGCESTTSDTD